MSWDPAQYGKFGDERSRPARDLLARVPLEAPRVVYDLGCGGGEATALIAARWPAAKVVGIDNSPAMLAKARESDLAADWVEADVGTWRAPEPADLVFANASLQWLGDHGTLFPRLAGMLGAGAALAVQMPRNFDAPSHRCMEEAAAAGPWRGRLAKAKRLDPVAGPEAYYDILAPHVGNLDIWETEYVHVLEDDNPVVEWAKGTELRPYLDALEGDERAAFLADYAARIAGAYPRRGDGRTLFPFRRLFIVAVR
ncbi:MAG: trans-aconitate 2-methyltransferase [Alphaproteobacteria bacterium]